MCSCASRISKLGISLRPKNLFRMPRITNNCLVLQSRTCASVPAAVQSLSRDEHRQNDRMELGPFFINYVKVPTLITGFDRDKFTFVTWDQPGYGLSRPPERIFTDDSMAEDADYLAKFMMRLGYRKYSVMGWSGGGNSALLFAIKYPHIINKLVVWGAFSYVNKEDAEIFKWFSDMKNTGGKMQEVLIEEYGEAFYKFHFPMWMEIFQRIHTVRRGELCSKNLPMISAPTLVIHGMLDNLVKARHAEFLRDHIPNSRLELWKDAKHNPHLRFPERFIESVQNFLLE